MIKFDRSRLGKLVIRGMAILAVTNAIATLPACSPGETPSNSISSSPSNPISSSPSNPTSSSPSNLDTVSPSPPAIASSVAKTPVPITPLSPKASPSIATPNSSIDYGGKTNRENWIVTDPDPQGLNCRWSSAIPKDWANPSAKFPRLNIQEWEVVRQFPQNTELKANNSPAGLITISDENGQPWLKVSIGKNDQICLVRANSQFVQPN